MKQQYSHDVFISFKFENQQIVDMIVNQLTNKYHISCWICTEKIRAGENFRVDISDAIDAAKIVVLVQSKLSATSKEVRQEIVEAVDAGKIIMPFIIEESQLSPSLQNLLKDIHYIDATKPTLDERICDLAKDICQTLGKPWGREAAQDPILISTPNVLPKVVFCGRDDVLQSIDEKFQNGERVLFLQGIGGIGKTQIAKQYAKQYGQNYDTVIYATYNGSIRDMVIAEAPFAIAPEMIRYTLSDGSQESDEAFFERKMKLIKKLADERTLIILDNFDVERDEYLPKLMEGKYHLLVTTRCDYSRYYPTIKINPLDSLDELKDVFMQNYKGRDVERDDPALVDLIELVNRHTYTIELLAQHMELSGQTADEMIHALKEQGIKSLGESIYNADRTTQTAYKNLLKMFEIFSLTEEEQQVLRCLSFMPLEGVRERDFRKWAGLTSAALIRNLENRSWIVGNTAGIALHPIIREVVRDKLPATEDNCSEFINRFTEGIEEEKTWHMKKSEKDRYAGIAKGVLSMFPIITPQIELLYRYAVSLFCYGVDTEYAQKLATKTYHYYANKFDGCSYEVAWAAFKLGWLYTAYPCLSNSIQNAYEWLIRADTIFDKIKTNSIDEIADKTLLQRTLSKACLGVYREKDDDSYYDLAYKYAICALKQSYESFPAGCNHYAKIAGAHLQIVEVLLAKEELPNIEDALAHTNIAVEMLISLYTEEDIDSLFGMHIKAKILSKMHCYEEAKTLAHKSAWGYIEYFGDKKPIIVDMFRLLGDCCVALNESAEAQEAYEKALEIATKLYIPGAMQITELQDKISKIERQGVC